MKKWKLAFYIYTSQTSKCRYQISSARHVFGITFTRQAQSQKIGKPNKYDKKWKLAFYIYTSQTSNSDGSNTMDGSNLIESPANFPYIYTTSHKR
jgi:hypothetical protein